MFECYPQICKLLLETSFRSTEVPQTEQGVIVTERTMTFLASIVSILLIATVNASSSTTLLRGVSNEDNASPCNGAKMEQSCYATTDSNAGGACLWCECQAIPSECLSPEQAKLVPSGVFKCSTPSLKSKKERITITVDPVHEDLCDVNSKSGYMSVEGSEDRKSVV